MSRRRAAPLLVLGLLGALAAPPVGADDAADELERKKTIAELEADIAEAERDEAKARAEELKARIGSITADLPGGDIKVGSGVTIEAHLLAYRAAACAAREIAVAVKAATDEAGKGEARVLLAGPALEDLGRLRAFAAQLELLEQSLPALEAPEVPTAAQAYVCEPAPAGPRIATIAPGVVLDAVLPLAGLFRSDVSIQGAAVTADQEALHALVERELLRLELDPIQPRLLLPKDSKLVARLREHDGVSRDYSRSMAAASALIEARLASKAYAACRKDLERDLRVLRTHLEATKPFRDSLAATIARLLEARDGRGVAEIEALVRAETLAEQVRDAWLLDLDFVAAGGNVKTRKGAFSSSLHFSGGAVVRYELVSPAGKVAAADTISLYGGYHRDEELDRALAPGVSPCGEPASGRD